MCLGNGLLRAMVWKQYHILLPPNHGKECRYLGLEDSAQAQRSLSCSLLARRSSWCAYDRQDWQTASSVMVDLVLECLLRHNDRHYEIWSRAQQQDGFERRYYLHLPVWYRIQLWSKQSSFLCGFCGRLQRKARPNTMALQLSLLLSICVDLNIVDTIAIHVHC